MKRRIQWMTALALAGSVTMALADTDFAAYDPDAVACAAGSTRYVPITAFNEINPPGRVADLQQVRTVVARSDAELLEPVAERIPMETQFAGIREDEPILSRSDDIGGVRFVKTTTRPRTAVFRRTLVRTRTLPADERLLPVAERLEPVAERRVCHRLAPVGERIAYRRLDPVGERITSRRLEPVGERITYRRLDPVGERLIYRRPEPVGERMVPRIARGNGPLVIREEVITTTRYHSAKKAKKTRHQRKSAAHHTRARMLEPVAEKTGRCSYRKVKVEPVGERRLIETRPMPVGERVGPAFSDGTVDFGNPYR